MARGRRTCSYSSMRFAAINTYHLLSASTGRTLAGSSFYPQPFVRALRSGMAIQRSALPTSLQKCYRHRTT